MKVYAALWPPPDKVRAPQAHKTPGALSNTLESDGTSSVPALQSPQANAQCGSAVLPQFRNRRAFLIWALMCGYTKPERVVERVIAELEDETT